MPSSTVYKRVFGIISLILLTASQSLGQINQDSRARTLAGLIATRRNEAVSDIDLVVRTASGEQTLKSNQEGEADFPI